MKRASLALGSIAVGVACHGSSGSPPPTSVTSLKGASIVMTDDAVLRISGATCGREVSCANVGTGKRFADAAECTVQTGHTTEREIGPSVCPSGVVEASLAQCLNDLRSFVCSIPLESPMRLPTCRPSVLCGAGEPR